LTPWREKVLKERCEVSDYPAQMAMAGHNGHQLKRIVLPSGKTIEVVYFDQVDRPYGSEETGSKYQGQAEPTPSRFYLNFEREKS
jgi:hypothetical protein